MRNLLHLLHTLPHLRFRQIFYQIWRRLCKAKYRERTAPAGIAPLKMVAPIVKKRCLTNGDEFCFLNLNAKFTDWNDAERGMLWAYNLNYMDWLGQEDMSVEEGMRWIDRFIHDFAHNKVGCAPYPTALRVINWVKFFGLHPEAATQARHDALFSQLCHLARNLEFHLLGNHLLEDAFSLFIGALYFADEKLLVRASRLLQKELEEQTLPDGAHYEQSPMYHCILLDRLLDAYNFALHNSRFAQQDAMRYFLRTKAEAMLGHLKAMVYSDGSIPLLNDAAEGIAPTTDEIFAYAERLGLHTEALKMREVGFRKLTNAHCEAFVDVGNIAATYQCGHSHADTFTYELRCNGRPFVVDTGISTYNKTARRLYERGTPAHNTVSINGENSSEVWSGFRIGRRAKTVLIKDKNTIIEARHDGFQPVIHTRRFCISEDEFRIEDTLSRRAQATSFIHFAPGCSVHVVDNHAIVVDGLTIRVQGATEILLKETEVATQYNRLEKSLTACINFHDRLQYAFVFKNTSV